MTGVGLVPNSEPLAELLARDAAGERLRQYGPNEVEEERERPGLAFLRKFWAPVPWMLESVIALQLFLGKVTERRPDRILASARPPSWCARQRP